jgi:molybdenum cofactor biosynthesis enzyme MoaA
MKKYCIMPFASVRIEDGKNKNSTLIRPCCLFNPDKKTTYTTLNEYFESDMLQELQQHLLTQDTLPLGCSTCRLVEETGQLSVRQLKNRYFDVDHLAETAIQELDIFPSNLCNLKCIMCSPKFSSAIGAEQKSMGLISEIINFDEADRVCEAIKTLPNLKYISVAGGEFFYAKHCIRILEQVQASGIEHFKITTNGTILNPKHIEILKHIPKLELRFSVDGTKDHYEFIRYPAKWDEVKQNILNYQQQLPNAKLETVIVVQPLNIFSVFDWLDFANQNNLETHWVNLLNDDLNWDMLTPVEKNIIVEFIKSGLKNSTLTSRQKISLLNYGKNTIARSEFDSVARTRSIEKIIRLCKHRKISLNVLNLVFKELPDLLQEIINYETMHHSHT